LHCGIVGLDTKAVRMLKNPVYSLVEPLGSLDHATLFDLAKDRK